MRHKVIGFDARELWIEPDSQWTKAKRDAILLRQDVRKPLSVDKFVWYSVFTEVHYPHLWQAAKRRDEYSGSEWDAVFSEDRNLTYSDTYPDDFRPRGIWTNLAHMQNDLQKSWGNIWKPCWLIAVAEVLGVDEEYETSYPILPSVVDSQWQLLGYDVASHELYSGLFNGKIKDDEATHLRTTWQDQLNKHHLFRDADLAFDYMEVADKRYSSHLPNYVYALYRIHTHAVKE